MAVTLNFTVCEASTNKSFTFNETTGAYSASNTAGWGTPNREFADAETATLAVTNPSNVTTTLNLFTSTFPTDSTTQDFIILSSDIGYASGAKLPDGLYTFVYTVTRTTATAFSYTQTKTVLVYGQMKCRVFSLFGDIPTEDCDCNTDAKELAFTANVYYLALKHAAATGNTTEFDTIMDTLTRLTANNDCNNC